MEARLKFEVKVEGREEIERVHEFLLLVKTQGFISDYFLRHNNRCYVLDIYYPDGSQDFTMLTTGDVLEVKEGNLRNKKEHEAIVEWLNKNAEVQG